MARMGSVSKNLYKTLQMPEIAPFVDWTKFVRSHVFDRLAADVVEHFHKHGDSTLIKGLVMPLAHHSAFHGTLVWLCRRAGLNFCFDEKGLVLKRLPVDAPCPPLLTLDAALREFTGTLARMRASLSPPEQLLSRPQFKPGGAGRRAPRDGKRGSWFVQGGAPGLGKRS